MASMSYSCLIRVQEEFREEDGDRFWLMRSQDLPGLLLGGRNLERLREDTPNVIQRLFKLNYDMDVQVHRVIDMHDLDKKTPRHQLEPPKAWTAVVPLAA